jgi:hypothetical protein
MRWIREVLHTQKPPFGGGSGCGVCQRPRVRADGSRANAGRVDGTRLCCLHGEAVEHGRH